VSRHIPPRTRSREVIEIKKNSGERIVIERTEYKGHELINCRVHFRDRNGDWHPTKRGLSMLHKHWEAILPFIQELLNQHAAVSG